MKIIKRIIEWNRKRRLQKLNTRMMKTLNMTAGELDRFALQVNRAAAAMFDLDYVLKQVEYAMILNAYAEPFRKV